MISCLYKNHITKDYYPYLKNEVLFHLEYLNELYVYVPGYRVHIQKTGVQWTEIFTDPELWKQKQSNIKKKNIGNEVVLQDLKRGY